MRIIAKSAIAAAGLSVSLAAATAAAETASEAGATPLLEEMVVTAARREQNLGDVAQTVQALLGEELLDVGVTNLEEAIQLIPSAVYNSTIGPGSTTFSIAVWRLGKPTGTQPLGTTSTTLPSPCRVGHTRPWQISMTWSA